MIQLKENWLTEGIIDFEYKKYILKAYFQQVEKSFRKVELYPVLAELIGHYQNLKILKEEKKYFQQNFPQSLSVIDIEKFQLIYEELIKDDSVMSELEDIIDYALPLFHQTLKEGKEIYEFVEEQCELIPIGLIPLYLKEGYFMISQPTQKVTPVFRYEVTVFESAKEKLRGIHTHFVQNFQIGLGQTFEQVKIKLARQFKELPNPAVFLIDTKQCFPCQSTVVPVAKRMLVRYVSAA